MSDTESRLVRLESLSAEQERVIGDLSDMVAEQWSTIEKLEKTCENLRDLLERLQDRMDDPEQEPPPPHY